VAAWLRDGDDRLRADVARLAEVAATETRAGFADAAGCNEIFALEARLNAQRAIHYAASALDLDDALFSARLARRAQVWGCPVDHAGELLDLAEVELQLSSLDAFEASSCQEDAS